jgi:hypothetical protein
MLFTCDARTAVRELLQTLWYANLYAQPLAPPSGHENASTVQTKPLETAAEC